VTDSPRERLAGWLKDGTAWKKFAAMVGAQGGDATALERITKIHHAPLIKPFPATRDGTIMRLDARTIGAASVRLGAGRQRASDTIDCAVGFSGIRKCGEQIAKGEPLFFIHARTEEALELARHHVAAAVSISK
jgi:thymidine phosphorylase